MKARKPTTRGSSSSRTAGFNGAAPLKARKQSILDDIWTAMEELQWGRAVEGAETTSDAPIIAEPLTLQWGRAVEGAETLFETPSP